MYCPRKAECCAADGASEKTRCELEMEIGLSQAQQASIDGGQFDPARAADCLNRVSTVSCYSHYVDDWECDGFVVTGKQPEGGKCTMDQHCAQPKDGVATCSSNRCAPYLVVALGEECGASLNRGCDESEAYCDGEPGHCVAPVEEGGDCSNFLARCRAGFHCSTKGTCIKGLPVDSPCENHQDCVDDAHCANKTCTADKSPGDDCSAAAECVYGCSITCRTKGIPLFCE